MRNLLSKSTVRKQPGKSMKKLRPYLCAPVAHCFWYNKADLITAFLAIKTRFTVHSRFRGSVNCWDPAMENRFQVTIFLFKVWKASILFVLVQNGPGVTWVACIGLRENTKWSFRCERAFLEAFWTFMLHLGHTVPASCGHGIPKQIIVNGYLC